jgi:hypothetical protein
MTLLISGLLLTAGNFVEDQQERAIRAELEVVGNRLASDIGAVDRLALAAGSDGKAELLSTLPPRTAGQTYLIDITPVTGLSNVYHLNLSTSDPDVEVSVRVRIQASLTSVTVNGGNVVVDYDGTDIEVRDG